MKTQSQNTKSAKKHYWCARELVTIGVFAAAAKLGTVLIAMIGGGMNPVSLIAKNAVFTILLVIMLFKVRKPGTLFLFTVVNTLISLLLLGGNVTLIPPALFAALAGEAVLLALGGYGRNINLYIGAALFDLLSKGASLGVSFLFMRESPALMAAVVPIILIGYIGSLARLWFGARYLKELRHAGIVRG